jgi:4-hydroxyphenylpyruvate dioxygenase
MKNPITSTPLNLQTSASKDPLALDGFHHVEIYCGNARQSAHYYQSVLGFTPVAYRGPETGFRDAASYVVRQNSVVIVLTSPLKMTSAIAHQLLVHGDTVHAVALAVPNVLDYFSEATKRGAKAVVGPREDTDQFGSVRLAAIGTYGDVIHPLIQSGAYTGPFLPGFVPYGEVFGSPPASSPIGIEVIDHIVGNVELGQMDRWVAFYRDVLGFSQMQKFSDDDIATEYSALMSRVMRDGSGRVKFPINEPATGRRKSQIEEYLDFHHGPGVQHIALRTNNIIDTITPLRNRGLRFLRVPETYYEVLPSRVGVIKEDLARLKELGVLVDRDPDGYLLQLFTKPLQDRPTLFFEFIQREGSNGFGIGNFKALFEAIEREQELRGNL